MRITRTGVAALAVAAVAVSVAAVGPADAAKRLITGADIKNNSVTGADIRESSLAAVPKANKLTVLKSGKSLTGAFGGGGGSGSTSGWYGEGLTFQQPLPGVPADYKVVDTYVNPDANACPGPGTAAKGYVCLYFTYHYNTGTVYKAYVSASGYPATPVSGLSIYYPITGSSSYASGSWTATAK